MSAPFKSLRKQNYLLVHRAVENPPKRVSFVRDERLELPTFSV